MCAYVSFTAVLHCDLSVYVAVGLLEIFFCTICYTDFSLLGTIPNVTKIVMSHQGYVDAFDFVLLI
jgi:hypothetical protein